MPKPCLEYINEATFTQMQLKLHFTRGGPHFFRVKVNSLALPTSTTALCLRIVDSPFSAFGFPEAVLFRRPKGRPHPSQYPSADSGHAALAVVPVDVAFPPMFCLSLVLPVICRIWFLTVSV